MLATSVQEFDVKVEDKYYEVYPLCDDVDSLFEIVRIVDFTSL